LGSEQLLKWLQHRQTKGSDFIPLFTHLLHLPSRLKWWNEFFAYRRKILTRGDYAHTILSKIIIKHHTKNTKCFQWH
jgi:hypothetical protein